MSWSEIAGYILPLDSQQEPLALPVGDHDENVVYVLQKPERTRPTRIVIASGYLGEGWDIGTWHEMYHDQSRASLGRYQVVGLVFYDDKGQASFTEGEVPERKMATAVFK